VYAAAGDGYFQSDDAGGRWTRDMDGLRHRYLVGIAVDPADPDTIVVSAAAGPGAAYRPCNAEAHVYRRAPRRAWEAVAQGFPGAAGTTVSCFATSAGEPGVMYAANNRGAYRSADAGRSWTSLDIPWPPAALAHGVHALACLPS
jgi:hypothetical protein